MRSLVQSALSLMLSYSTFLDHALNPLLLLTDFKQITIASVVSASTQAAWIVLLREDSHGLLTGAAAAGFIPKNERSAAALVALCGKWVL